MSEALIRLTVPAELAFRDVAIRAIAAAARLVRDAASQGTAMAPLDLAEDFDAELVSAVSEIFNNIVIHGHEHGSGEKNPHSVDFELRLSAYSIEVVITDHGAAFDIGSIPDPELDNLPEGGMGIHIARSCVDDLDYTPGPPNEWRLTKRTAQSSRRPSTQV